MVLFRTRRYISRCPDTVSLYSHVNMMSFWPLLICFGEQFELSLVDIHQHIDSYGPGVKIEMLSD